jgi:exo-beta-1,3-glucanase (GH17 family)
MKTSPLTALFTSPLRRVGAGLLALAASAVVLVACGGGGTVPKQGVSLRALSPEFTSRKAAAYSPYRTSNRDTESVTVAHIQEDMGLLLAANIKLIRLFDSSDNVSRATLQAIRDNHYDIKVMLGIYIASGNTAFNTAEIARGIALANEFADIVLAVSVGNETMVSWSFNAVAPATMATYITQVRNAVKQPVTTDDNWAFYAAAPTTITDIIDFAAVHTYPLADSIHPPAGWDWQQTAVAADQRATAMMDAAIGKAKTDFGAVRTYFDGKGLNTMPIIIGETGWKAVISDGETGRASPVNQKMYADRLVSWMSDSVKPSNIVYFEAFDEPWKGNDDKWSMYNVNRQARCMIQSVVPASVAKEPGSCAATDAVYYLPPVDGGQITADRYTLYADAITAGEFRDTGIKWSGYDSPPNAYAGEGSSGGAEGIHFREVGPVPAAYGWGIVTYFDPVKEVDMSLFATTGKLNVSIKTTYAGNLQLGFSTAAGAVMVKVKKDNSDGYGFINDGNWHNVSIPISVIKAAGATDLTKVSNPFQMQDVYGQTGNTNNGDTTKVFIDNIYWSK